MELTAQKDVFIRNLKLLKAHAGYSQTDLANATGLHLATIQKIERGFNLPSDTSLKLIAKAFGYEPEALLKPLRVVE